MMRALVLVVLAAFAAIAAQERAPTAEAVLASAHEAMGGARRLADVKTFVATGRTRQVRGDNLVPIEFEISCELPDKYIRRYEFPAQDAGPATIGFNGNALIQIPAAPGSPPSGRPAGPPPPTAAQLEAASAARVTAVKQDVARLMLGMFAGSISSVPLTFTYIGIAEAPQGQADVLEVKGPANFAARFFVYKTTHLPIMVSWQAAAGGPQRGGAGPSNPSRGEPPRVPPPGPPPGASPPGAPPSTAAANNPVDTRLYFADYRDVDGIKWPFRVRRALGADTIEETTFDRFRINARIDAKKFEAR
jgi:hypothetical protein